VLDVALGFIVFAEIVCIVLVIVILVVILVVIVIVIVKTVIIGVRVRADRLVGFGDSRALARRCVPPDKLNRVEGVVQSRKLAPGVGYDELGP
jgi:hypothetical protein